jgi:hypothetical protein
LLALSIPENIDFGTMAMGASTTTVNDQETVFTQKGNTAASVEVNSPAENFTCSIRGTIPRQNQRWSLSTFDWAAGTAIGGTPVDANINIALQTDDYTIPTDSLFWGIKIPESGLEGICTNVVVIAAIAQ